MALPFAPGDKNHDHNSESGIQWQDPHSNIQLPILVGKSGPPSLQQVDRTTQGLFLTPGKRAIVVPGTGYMMIVPNSDSADLKCSKLLKSQAWLLEAFATAVIDVWEVLGSLKTLGLLRGDIKAYGQYILVIGVTHPAQKLSAFFEGINSPWDLGEPRTQQEGLPLTLLKASDVCLPSWMEDMRALDIWYSHHCPYIFPVGSERVMGAGKSLHAIARYYNRLLEKQPNPPSQSTRLGMHVNGGRPFWEYSTTCLKTFALIHDDSLLQMPQEREVVLDLPSRLALQMRAPVLWEELREGCGRNVTAVVDWLRQMLRAGYSLYRYLRGKQYVLARWKKNGDGEWKTLAESLAGDQTMELKVQKVVETVEAAEDKTNYCENWLERRKAFHGMKQQPVFRTALAEVVSTIPPDTPTIQFYDDHFIQVSEASMCHNGNLFIPFEGRERICVLPAAFEQNNHPVGLEFPRVIPERDFVFFHKEMVSSVFPERSIEVAPERSGSGKSLLWDSRVPFEGAYKRMGTVGLWKVVADEIIFLGEGHGDVQQLLDFVDELDQIDPNMQLPIALSNTTYKFPIFYEMSADDSDGFGSFHSDSDEEEILQPLERVEPDRPMVAWPSHPSYEDMLQELIREYPMCSPTAILDKMAELSPSLPPSFRLVAAMAMRHAIADGRVEQLRTPILTYGKDFNYSPTSDECENDTDLGFSDSPSGFP